MSVKITDLVDQETIDKIGELNNEIQKALNTYTQAAKEMAKGLSINVKVVGDLDKLEKLLIDKTKEAVETQGALTEALEEQCKVIANTTNTKARDLMEQERLNKAKREEYKDGSKVREILSAMTDSYADNAKAMVRLKLQIDANKKSQHDLDLQYKNNLVTESQYIEMQSRLIAEERDLAVQKSKLQQVMKIEEKMNNEQKTSYNHLSQQLELLKKTYNELSEAQKDTDSGREMLKSIQVLDAHLKDLAADMGDHQRNVGNYAIALSGANSSIKKDLKDLVLNIANLSIEYEKLSEEEKNSAEGRALADHIRGLTEQAGELKDAISDTNTAISNAASDTRGFDQLGGTLQLAIDGFGLATGAAEMLGISEGELAEIQTKLQAAIAASNAMQSIQNTLQKESAVMQGVALLQTRLRTVAENLHTAAQGRGVVATKALTAAQWAFNAAANANPIGLLIAGIVAAVAAVWGLTKAFSAFVSPSQKALEQCKSMKESIDEMSEAYDRNTERMKARGATEVELMNRSIEHTYKVKEATIEYFETISKYYKKDSDEYKEAEEAKKKAEEEYRAVVEGGINFLLKIKTETSAKERELEIGTLAFKIEIIEEEKKKQLELAETLLANKEITKQMYEEIVASVNKAAEFKVKDATESEQKKTKVTAGSSASDAKKQADELKKAVQEGEDALLKIISDSLERQIETERLSYSRQLKELQDKLAKTKDTQIELRTSLNRQIEGLTAEHNRKMEELDESKKVRTLKAESDIVASRLEIVEKGSIEELNLKIRSLENQRQTELLAVLQSERDKTITLEQAEEMRANIVEKYAALEQKAIEEHAGKQADRIMEQYAVDEVKRSQGYSQAVNDLKMRYAEELEAAQGNAAEQERLKAKLDKDLYELDVNYSRMAAEESIRMLQKVLDMDELSEEDRLKYEQELAKAKIDLEGKMADAAVKAAEDAADADSKLKDKRLKNILEWVGVAQEGISNISDLVNALFDRQVSKIEDEQEANEEAGEKEQERITELVNKKVITQEEGEARKRAAEAQTAKKNEELEKKKGALEYKQAIYQKAVSIANIGIDTAAAIMKLWSQLGIGALPMQVVVGTIGALQLATALATPIPKYARGTDYHPGGPAIVGDAGRHELVMFKGEAWLTPDRPTIVDIPEGAKVIPDMKIFSRDDLNMIDVNSAEAQRPSVIVNNDYSDLRREIKAVGDLIRRQTKVQRQIANEQQYEIFKKSI